MSLVTCLIAPLALALSGSETLPAEDALADIAIAREAITRIHPGYDRYTPRADLEAAWSALEREAADGMGRDQLYLDLSLLLADIRCDHTKAELPADLAEARSETPVYLPFRFRTFDGRMYVDRPGQTGLRRGDEILTLDGVSAAQRMAAVLPYLPVDGFTDEVRWLELRASSEFMGSGFDHFDPLLNPVSDRLRLTVRRGARTFSRTVDRLTFEAFQALTGAPRYRNFSDPGNVRVESVGQGVAVLRQGTFVNYRTPVDPMTVYGPIFEDLDARGVDTLILDMRANGGGSVDAQNALLAHLLSAPYVPVREVRTATTTFAGLEPYIDTWNRAALNPNPAWFTPAADGGGFILSDALSDAGTRVHPAANAFTGDLIILTGPANSSGATQIIGALRDQRGALLVGEATGGSQDGPTAGLLFFVALPHSGIRVRVPVQRAYQNIADPAFGQGYAPDIPAPDTLQSWLAGRDPALEAAIAAARR